MRLEGLHARHAKNCMTYDMKKWSEAELYAIAFEGAGDYFPVAPDGQPLTCDDVFDTGESGAALAILAIALTETLSPASRTTLMHFYHALAPIEGRSRYKLVAKQVHRGRKQKTEIDEWREAIDDSLINRMVELIEEKVGKREAAVAEVAAQRNISRAAVFRSLARHLERPEDFFD